MQPYGQQSANFSFTAPHVNNFNNNSSFCFIPTISIFQNSLQNPILISEATEILSTMNETINKIRDGIHIGPNCSKLYGCIRKIKKLYLSFKLDSTDINKVKRSFEEFIKKTSKDRLNHKLNKMIRLLCIPAEVYQHEHFHFFKSPADQLVNETGEFFNANFPSLNGITYILRPSSRPSQVNNIQNFTFSCIDQTNLIMNIRWNYNYETKKWFSDGTQPQYLSSLNSAIEKSKLHVKQLHANNPTALFFSSTIKPQFEEKKEFNRSSLILPSNFTHISNQQLKNDKTSSLILDEPSLSTTSSVSASPLSNQQMGFSSLILEEPSSTPSPVTASSSDQKAIEVFNTQKLQAEKGDLAGQFNVAMLYEYGIGTECDKAAAIKYYLLAADQGDEAARLSALSLIDSATFLKSYEESMLSKK